MKADKIQNLEQKAYEFVSLFEGFESRAYYDSEGIPTIGYGFNLTQPSPCKLLENQLSYQGHSQRLDWMTYTKQIKDLKFEKSKKDEYTLRQEGVLKDTDKWKEILKILDASYEKKLTKLPHSITLSKDQLSQKKKALSSILQTHFPFMITKEKAKEVLQKLIPEYSQILENRMSSIENFELQKQQIQALKGSYEWIALLSLSYTNPSSLIGPKLCLALKNNDRFRAWFEIRYQSNKDKDIGLAKRRFAESNCFGLFDGYKRGEFKKTLWKQEKEFKADALEIFESLHSLKRDGEKEISFYF
ncbi:hypothetical protein [Helicobacter kayseriensis]|uniref:hypothetical protein n=1 Tax=Helicobacter kayseriensis TaxID=2905877 RepID=UPI001E616499|nr:hypothetical protein [Helicobacter kayseriensis]MCE3047827.1 hypothetical protein [Helicobacter kayseriensis]MCE3049196.1 hypothetical protein [Helicobacter kayseriensis]